MRSLGVPDRVVAAVRVAFAAILLIAMTVLAHAQDARPLRGVAMVIGNSAYQHLPPLANPANDARAIEKLLSALGFETELSSDRDARRLARDLDIFLDDAEGADVAILYYAGHGIEAGGENFLVPVDADLSALEAAGEKLVPISAFIERLQASVPVTILMLDACRDNPFPPGSVVRLDPSSAPAPMSQEGLGETRGAASLARAAGPRNENYGSVVAFAAEPGRVALDGAPGGNSPYTAAVLRHLETMAGEEFGTVMRMVAEEVYLKTAGRQRPWVNESLRRLLYFGAAPAPVSGVEGDILAERRQLLITISALPMQGRNLVERVAGDNGVPMDALFAMLDTLGEDLPDDPAELDRLLRRLADDLKGFLEERAALRSADPEIVRLSQLAEVAAAEGALATAVSLYERVKALMAEASPALDEAEENLRQRRIERAGFYGRSGEMRALALDRLGAAEDFELAAREVERWDDELNRRYRLAQARALIDHGVIRGDTPALERAVALLDELGRAADTAFAAEAGMVLADALSELGRRQTVNDALERAVATYRTLLESAADFDRASAMRRLGAALLALGRRDIGQARLQEAVAALEEALALHGRASTPLAWAAVQVELGRLRAELWERDRTGDALDRAIAHYRAALEELDAGASPAAWAAAQLGLGRTLRLAGLRAAGGYLPGAYFGWLAATAGNIPREITETFRQSVEAFDAVLEVCGREIYPVCWANAHHGRAVALYSLGSTELDDEEAGFGHFRRAMASFESALSEQRFDMAPMDWAETYAGRAEMLYRFGLRSASGIDLIYLAEAARGYRDALAVIDPRSLPAMWVDINNRLAGTFEAMRSRDRREGASHRHRRSIVRHHRDALEGLDPQRDREAWTGQMREVGRSLGWMGYYASDPEPVREAIGVFAEIGDMDLWTDYHDTLGRTLMKRAKQDDSPELAREARHAFEVAWNGFRKGRGDGAEGNIRNLAGAEETLAEFETGRLERAAAGYRAALTRQARMADPHRWARNQVDLAAILRALAQRTQDDALLIEALAAYEAALEEWTPEREPMRFGTTRDLIGDVLRLQAERGGGAAHSERAVAAYRQAMAVLTPQEAPWDQPRLSDKLAETLLDLARHGDSPELARQARHVHEEARMALLNPQDFAGRRRYDAIAGHIAQADEVLAAFGTERLEETAASYRSVLTPEARAADPHLWARNQVDLAAILRLLGERAGDDALLEDAVAAYRAALEEWTLQAAPARFGLTRDQKGQALNSLAERGAAHRFDEAVAAYEAALAGLTPRDAPRDHARIRRAAGLALHYSIGVPRNDHDALRRAVAHYRAAAEIDTIEANPVSFAALQRLAGFASLELAQRGAGNRHAADAVEAHRLAATVVTAESSPAWWAMNEEYLAHALVHLGEAEGDMTMLEEAAAHFEAAMQAHVDLNETDNEKILRSNLARTLQVLGSHRSDMALLERSVAQMRQSLVGIDRDTRPNQWSWRHRHLGHALLAIGELGGGRLDEAIAAYREVLAVRPREAHAVEWAEASHSIAYAMLLSEGAGGDARVYEEATAMARSVIPVYEEAGLRFHLAAADILLCVGQARLALARADAAMAREAFDACERSLPVIVEDGDARQKEQARAANDEARAALAELEGAGDAQ